MATVEERLAFLEGRVAEHSQRTDDIRNAIVHFEERVDRRFAAVDARFRSIDLRLDGMDRRLTGLDEKMTRYFVWLVGFHVTTLAAIVAALASR